MEKILAMILLLQVVMLIQIMRGRRQVLQYFKTGMEKEAVTHSKAPVAETQNTYKEEIGKKQESRENAMKLVDEVLTEVFS